MRLSYCENEKLARSKEAHEPIDVAGRAIAGANRVFTSYKSVSWFVAAFAAAAPLIDLKTRLTNTPLKSIARIRATFGWLFFLRRRAPARRLDLFGVPLPASHGFSQHAQGQRHEVRLAMTFGDQANKR
jgi:hypothetical protein